MDRALFKSGLVRRPLEQRFRRYSLAREDVTPLPSSVIDPHLSPICNQGSSNACTGFSTAWFWQQVLNTLGIPCPLLSAKWAYWYARIDDKAPTNKDSGASVRGVFDGLHDVGIALERDWPNDSFISDRPPDVGYSQGLKLPGEPVSLASLDEVKHALARGLSVVFGLSVYNGWFHVGKNGKIPIPDPWKEMPVGGHAIAGCGYDDKSGMLTLANSWGEREGQDGFFFLPYEYLGLDYWEAFTIDNSSIAPSK